MKIDLESMFARYDSEPKTNMPLPTEEITSLKQTVENVKDIFSGTKVVPQDVVKAMLPKLKLAEWGAE